MRLLRFALLTNYFLKKKNFNRAIKLINIGIFLAIFASTSAIISLSIENKISLKEYQLISNQRDLTNLRKAITSLKAQYYIFEFDQTQENKDYETELYNNETKFNFKLVSSNDFYKPYIFFVIKEEEQFRKTLGDSFIKELKSLINDAAGIHSFFSPLNKKGWNKKIQNFESQRKKFVDTVNYNVDKFLINEKVLFDELNNISSSTDFNFTNQVRTDYAGTFAYKNSSIDFIATIIEISGGLVSKLEIENKFIGKEIIKLSKLEKNLILTTFLLQLAIFIIIQLFEISSINKEKKIKLI